MIAPYMLNSRGQTSIQLPLIRYILTESSSILCFEVKQTWKQLYHAQWSLQTLHHRVVKERIKYSCPTEFFRESAPRWSAFGMISFYSLEFSSLLYFDMIKLLTDSHPEISLMFKQMFVCKRMLILRMIILMQSLC